MAWEGWQARAALSVSTEAAAGEPIWCQACGDGITAHDPGICGTCFAVKYRDTAPPAASGQKLTDEHATLISRMRKDETRGDTVFRCGFNGAIDAVLKLIDRASDSATASDKEGA